MSISVKPQWYAPISVCSTIGIYTMVKVFPLIFVIRVVDPKSLVHMRLWGYLEDEMFRKIGCLILMKINLLQRESRNLGRVDYCQVWFSQNSINTTNKSIIFATIGIWCCCHYKSDSWQSVSWRHCCGADTQQIRYKGTSLGENVRWNMRMGFKCKIPGTISFYLLPCVG